MLETAVLVLKMRGIPTRAVASSKPEVLAKLRAQPVLEHFNNHLKHYGRVLILSAASFYFKLTML